MRFSVTDLFGYHREPAPSLHATPRKLDPEIASLLEPFLRQSASIRSIIAFGHNGSPDGGPDATLLRLHSDEDGPAAIASDQILLYPDTFDGLARLAAENCGATPGDDLLLLPADLLVETIPAESQDFRFRAIAALFPATPAPRGDDRDWRLRRSLFDRGLICVGSVPVAGGKALCFLASDAVRAFDLDVDSRGHVSMSELVGQAGFANQLFRYSCVKLYALRHALTLAVQPWPGEDLYGLADKPCAGLNLPEMRYPAFASNDREFWDSEKPPIDVDLAGYFQEIPGCWQKHRPLLRNMFQLSAGYVDALNAWRQDVTAGGQRTLVAIHVRRGDDRAIQKQSVPWFRIVPETWYLAWLRAIWPTLREPILYVATDEPGVVLPMFREFETVLSAPVPLLEDLPDDLRDFEMMRRADYLALCNSSFSRMAAILAPSTQQCFLPSFQSRSFEPYEPWIDPAFWVRFADSWRRTPRLTADTGNASAASQAQPAIFFEISDLLLYLLHQTTLSGIQRVECEFLRNVAEIAQPQLVRFVVLNRGGLCAIDSFALLDVIEDIRSGCAPRESIECELRELLGGAIPCTVQAGDTFLSIGAFWNVRGMGALLQELKQAGAIVGVFIHDILPIVAPEYFETAGAVIFVKGLVEALTFTDFILTTSEFNKAALAEHMDSRFDPVTIRVVPLGHELPATPAESNISPTVEETLQTDYVLCVGTIEVRKNPLYLLNVWKMMVRSGRSDIPTLVFAGRKGWLVQDFLQQLTGCDYLGGKIVILQNVSDLELDKLYRHCMLTVFPSFVEGWGLPVGESLAHGKICICSNAGGIPEVGGDLVDYIDPYNVRDGLQQLLRYIDDPGLRRSREREIAAHFQPRTWRQASEDFLSAARALAGQPRPREGAAAILLPRERYMSISTGLDATQMTGMDGRRSAELILASGWQRPESTGVRPAQATALIQFRADAPVGARISLALRLRANGGDFRVRIRSGSGAGTEVSLKPGSERVASLSCVVEPGNLVTAQLLSIGATLAGDDVANAAHWMLQGLLYFDPKSAVGARPNRLTSMPPEVDRIQLREAQMGESSRAHSLDLFRQTNNSYWLSKAATDRQAPIFSSHDDSRAFESGCGKSVDVSQVGNVDDCVKLLRRSDLFVSTTRFSEGSVFDRSGAWKALGYLRRSPPGSPSWFSTEADSVWINQASLAAAPVHEGSYLIFYNGNLHNYYHWLAEGLLCLDILARALGPGLETKIVLPKSMEIHAVLDHRETLRATGFTEHQIVEVDANLIQVQEAIWVDSDQVQTMPAPHLRQFQQRIAALYPGVQSLPRRRLLVARKGPVRTIQNLDQVQALLSKYDFETVYLDGKSMAEQIVLFQSAEFVIGPHGAGLANLLFCHPRTKVIELMPNAEFRPFFWLISQKLDLVYGLQFCAPAGDRGFQSGIQVDTGKLEALIRLVQAQR